MIKIYLRTLKKSIKYAAILLGILFVGGPLFLVTLANFFTDVPYLSTLILLGTPTLVVFCINLEDRKNDSDLAKAYRSTVETPRLRVGKDIRQILRTKRLWMELAVFCTYLAILCIIGGRIIFTTPVRTTLLLIGCVALFLVLDVASWLIVHRAYRSQLS